MAAEPGADFLASGGGEVAPAAAFLASSAFLAAGEAVSAPALFNFDGIFNLPRTDIASDFVVLLLLSLLRKNAAADEVVDEIDEALLLL